MLIPVNSAQETRTIGDSLAQVAMAGDVLWLHGDLGAGKTEMTKGVATGLQAADPVSSPSFALIHEYRGGRLPLYHIDLYRLDTGPAQELGLEDYLEGNGLTVIEWGERLPINYFPDGIDVTLSYCGENDQRTITISARGVAGNAWWQRFTTLYNR